MPRATLFEALERDVLELLPRDRARLRALAGEHVDQEVDWLRARGARRGARTPARGSPSRRRCRPRRAPKRASRGAPGAAFCPASKARHEASSPRVPLPRARRSCWPWPRYSRFRDGIEPPTLPSPSTSPQSRRLQRGQSRAFRAWLVFVVASLVLALGGTGRALPSLVAPSASTPATAGPSVASCPEGTLPDEGGCVHRNGPDMSEGFGAEPMSNAHRERSGKWAIYEQIPKLPERPAEYEAYRYPVPPGMPGGKYVVSGYDLDRPTPSSAAAAR